MVGLLGFSDLSIRNTNYAGRENEQGSAHNVCPQVVFQAAQMNLRGFGNMVGFGEGCQSRKRTNPTVDSMVCTAWVGAIWIACLDANATLSMSILARYIRCWKDVRSSCSSTGDLSCDSDLARQVFVQFSSLKCRFDTVE